MAVIRINPVQVIQAGTEAAAARRQTAAVKNGVNELRYRLDPRVKSRRNMEERLKSVAEALEKAEAKIVRIAGVAENGAEGYQHVEQQIEKRSRDLLAGPSEASPATLPDMLYRT